MLDIIWNTPGFGMDHPATAGRANLLSEGWHVSLHIAAEVWP